MSGGGKIQDLVSRLERMGSDAWRAQLSWKLAQATLKMIDQTFDKQRSPYGDTWRERKGKYPWSMLQKTGSMRFGYRIAQADARGFKIWNQQAHAIFQQFGTRNGIDAREMVPVAAFSLPTEWKREYECIAAAEVRALMRDGK